MSGSWFPVLPLPEHVLLPHGVINVKVKLSSSSLADASQGRKATNKKAEKENARTQLVTQALLQLVLNESRRGEREREGASQVQVRSAYADTQDAAREWFFRGPATTQHHTASALVNDFDINRSSPPPHSKSLSKWYVRGSGKRESGREETLLCAMSLVHEKEKKDRKTDRKILKALVGGHHLLDLYSVGCVCRILQVSLVEKTSKATDRDRDRDRDQDRYAIVTLEGLSRVLVKSASIVMPSLSSSKSDREEAVVMGHCFWPELEPLDREREMEREMLRRHAQEEMIDIRDVRNMAEALYHLQRQVFSDQPKMGEGLGKLVKSLWQMSQLGNETNNNNNKSGSFGAKRQPQQQILPFQVRVWATEVADLLLASPLLDNFMSREQRLEVLGSCSPKTRIRLCTSILRGISRKGASALPLIKVKTTATSSTSSTSSLSGGERPPHASKNARGQAIQVRNKNKNAAESSAESDRLRDGDGDGDGDEEDTNEWAELEQKLKNNLPRGSKVYKEAMREFRRIKDAASFRNMPPQPGDNMMRKWLECVADVPWLSNREADDQDKAGGTAKSNQHVLLRAIQVMDERHFGLKSVKRRIVQYLAVQQLLRETEALEEKEGQRRSTTFTLTQNKNKTKVKNPVILCLVGPPGVGKTSLAQTIAESLQRPMERVSLGGVRDESEIRGHRRTYIGAMPGRIVQAMIRAQTKKPVILLDEIDKAGNPEIGVSVRGDPLGALLEVLDPEQNSSFVDHYVGHALDLSEVFFIATANSLAHMPPALRDRLEIVQLEAYSPQEKGAIGTTHLWPKQLLRHGLGSSNVHIEPLENQVVEYIAENYTREAGVRQLERCLASICRHIATKVALNREKALSSSSSIQNQNGKMAIDKAAISNLGGEHHKSAAAVVRDQSTHLVFKVDVDLVQEVLGPPKVSRTSYKHLCARLETPGCAAGLAWTSSGTGTVQLVETTCIRSKASFTPTNSNPNSGRRGKEGTKVRGSAFAFPQHHSTTGRLTLTGQLGEVLEESAHIALTLVRSMCSQYLEDPHDLDLEGEDDASPSPNQKTKLYENVMFSDVHVHLPAGSVPKDGPSAGVTLAVALTSLFFGYGCRADTAMTGEISLNGFVLAVGGVAEKVRAANKIGISRVIVPLANEREARQALRGMKHTQADKSGKDGEGDEAGGVRTEIIPVKTVSEALEAAIVGGNPWASHSTSMQTSAAAAAAPMAKL